MSLLDFVNTLPPILERKDVSRSINDLRVELQEYTLPVAETMEQAFKGQSIQSQMARQFFSAFSRKVNYNTNGIDVLVTSLRSLNTNLSVIEAQVKRSFGSRFTRSEMTFNRANLLRYIELADFYVRYFRKLALRIIASEAKTLGKATPQNWSLAEDEWVTEGQEDFINLFSVIDIQENELKKLLTDTSDARLNDETYQLAISSIGKQKTDPMRLGFVSPQRNLFFSIAKTVSELQVKRHQQAIEDRKALELRLMEMTRFRDGQPMDARAQQEIAYTERRIEKLDYQLATFQAANSYE